MADDRTTTLPVPDAGDGPPAEGRGRTTIADKVLERLAVHIAREIPGVVHHTTGAGPLGANLPTATVETAGARVRLVMRVALDWECTVVEVAAQVRDQVRRRLGDLTGKTVDRVDVTVAALIPVARQARTERRVL